MTALRTRLALVTEIPAPFRLPLFAALATQPRLDLEVLFLSENDPRRNYPVYREELGFPHRFLRGAEIRRGDRWLVLNRGTLRALLRFRPDVIVVGGWNQPAFWTGLVYAQARRLPLVTWIESTGSDARPEDAFLERAKRAMVGRSAAILVPGRAAASYAAALGVPRERIAVAPNAVDLRIFDEAVARAREGRDALRRDLGLTRPTALTVARLDPEKGIDVLLEAAEGLDADFVVIGTGAREAELQARAPANVRFTGRLSREELVPWYAAADLFVLPSLSEPWGMVLNEAAAARLPIVATEAAGAAHDLVDEGASGFRVSPGDAPALRRALLTLLEDEGLRERAGLRSAELASTFTPAAWAEAVAGLAQRLGSAR